MPFSLQRAFIAQQSSSSDDEPEAKRLTAPSPTPQNSPQTGKILVERDSEVVESGTMAVGDQVDVPLVEAGETVTITHCQPGAEITVVVKCGKAVP